MIDLSIIILNYKQKGLVRQCIKGILSAQPQLNYEIIVVDNNSQDGCLSAVKELFIPSKDSNIFQKHDYILPPLKTIQSEKNIGFGAGNNLGIKESAGEYVLILNPDIAVVPAGLEKMVSFMKDQPDIGIIGPKLINPDGSIQDSCRRFPSWPTPFYRRTFLKKLPAAKKVLDYYLMADWDHKNSISVDWIFGACLLVRKSVFDKIGFFDERFFMYFEDLDLCRRCWVAGFKVFYFVKTEMVHYHQRLSAKNAGIFGVLSKAGRIHFISGFKYFAKYFGVKLPNRQSS